MKALFPLFLLGVANHCAATDAVSVQIIILGQVLNPGRIAVPSGSSIDSAIQAAGGLKNPADGVAISTLSHGAQDIKSAKPKFFIRFDDHSFVDVLLKQIKVEEGDVIWVVERL
jgi:protein involved in polysaccharide export with SLBB domain